MAFTDFTLESVETQLAIRCQIGTLFPGIEAIAVPSWLNDFLARGMQLALMSEKARSEFIVGPVLLACRELTNGTMAIYSGQRLDVDSSRGLSGECDFILALSDPLPRLKAPLMTIVEAKKNDIDQGIGQCVAQMVAAREFNLRDKIVADSIFGCVTTGELWQFLVLSGSTVTIDRERLYIKEVGGILSRFLSIVNRFVPLPVSP